MSDQYLTAILFYIFVLTRNSVGRNLNTRYLSCISKINGNAGDLQYLRLTWIAKQGDHQSYCKQQIHDHGVHTLGEGVLWGKICLTKSPYN
jgi:hypothetical protein